MGPIEYETHPGVCHVPVGSNCPSGPEPAAGRRRWATRRNRRRPGERLGSSRTPRRPHAMPSHGAWRGGRSNRRQRRQPQCPLGAEVRLWRSCADGDFLATGTLFGAKGPFGTHPARRHHGPDGWPTLISLRPAMTRIKASLDVNAGESRTAFATTGPRQPRGSWRIPLRRRLAASAAKPAARRREVEGLGTKLTVKCTAALAGPETKVNRRGASARWFDGLSSLFFE